MLLCSASRTSHTISRAPFHDCRCLNHIPGLTDGANNPFNALFRLAPLVLLNPAWSLRQRPKPLQRTDAHPVVALHPDQRQLLASRLVERPQRKRCHLPIVSCNPCATVLGHDLLNNSISPNQATQTETQTRRHRGNDGFDQGLWRLKRSGIIRREPIFS